MSFYSFRDMIQIGDAVANALYEALKYPNQSEPQLIANLVFELPKEINNNIFSRFWKITAGGVFVHSRPFVKCSSFPEITPKSVEMGDLLLIRTLVVRKKVKERRALLLQAKKISDIPAIPDNKNQWHLYEKWPEFEYAARSGSLTGKKRKINESDMYDAAKYLLIHQDTTARRQHCICCMDFPFHWICPWPKACFNSYTAQPTAPKISRYRYFVGELVEFLMGKAGKVFTNQKPKTLEWNRVIWDLIEETANAKTIYVGRSANKYKPANQSEPAKRGSGVLSFLLAGQSRFSLFGERNDDRVNNVEGPPNVPEKWNDDGNDGGISIIEFVVESRED